MSSSEKPLAIDIPVQLPELKVAFSVAALAFEGDLPASIFHLELIAKDADDWNAVVRLWQPWVQQGDAEAEYQLAYTTSGVLPLMTTRHATT